MQLKPKKDIYGDSTSLLPEEQFELDDTLTPSSAELPQKEDIQELYRQQMQKMDEDYKQSRTMDEISSLVNAIAPALSGRARARAITSAGSLKADPGEDKPNLKTNRAEESRLMSKDRLQSLLEKYKLGNKQSPQPIKIGNKLVTLDPVTGKYFEAYSPTISEEEQKGKQLQRESLEADIGLKKKQLNQKPGDNLTPEQKENALVDLELKKVNLLAAQKKITEDPDTTEIEKQKALLEIQKLMVQNAKTQKELDAMDKKPEASDLDNAKVRKLDAETRVLGSKAEQSSNQPSIFEKKKMEKLAGAGVEYITKDRDQLVSNVKKIDVALGLIDKAPSGEVSGPYRGLVSDHVRAVTNPEAVIVKESMQSAIQETLRPTLGAQFTEKEGERIMNLAYNDTLPPKENKRRANALKEFIQKKVKFSDDLYRYLDENGSDKGFPYENYGMNRQGSTTDAEANIRTKVVNGQPVKFRKTSKGWEQVQ